LISSLPSYAQIFGTVRVMVRDPQNLAVANAQVVVRAKNSQWIQSAKTTGGGIAIIPAVPIGDYRVSISAEGFTAATDKEIQVTADKITPLQVQLVVSSVEQSVEVVETVPPVNPESSTGRDRAAVGKLNCVKIHHKGISTINEIRFTSICIQCTFDASPNHHLRTAIPSARAGKYKHDLKTGRHHLRATLLAVAAVYDRRLSLIPEIIFGVGPKAPDGTAHEEGTGDDLVF
jgi:Carboxypeptidase regulatory-like domain